MTYEMLYFQKKLCADQKPIGSNLVNDSSYKSIWAYW